MCLLFCFVIFWMLCCVMCEKINKNVDDKKIVDCSRVLYSVGQKHINEGLHFTVSSY